jgi:prepilin-type N-terminal cleavage/methylation domain-containing protein
LINRLNHEAGYSLVEVMVAIMLLSIAIIPMVGMFDAGLRAATQGSSYDKARALANKQMETAKNLPYATVRDNSPTGTGAPSTVTGVIESSNQTDAGFSGFTYKVRKAYVRLDPASGNIVEDATARTMMKVTVTVNWGGGKSYSTTGLVS